MSTEYSAVTLIGIPIPADYEFFATGSRKIRTFEHDHPESWEFDPKTGEKLWKEEKTYHPDWNRREDDEFFGEFEIFRAQNQAWLIHHKFRCSFTHRAGRIGFSPILTMQESGIAMSKFKSLLEPLNAWDESQFGIYTVMYTW